jgi:large subunit ribosomal protein L23
MALFGKKDAKKEVAVAKVAKEKKTPALTAVAPVSMVIVKPRITEKAAVLGEKNVYTFEVKKGATKYDVRDAIKALYNVTPVKVNIVNKVPRKTMSRARGRKVTEHGLRKAYVFLKEGDRIELV